MSRALRWLAAVLALGFALNGAAATTLRVVGDNNYPPYLFIGPDGKPQGYLVDEWKLWQKKTGIKVEITLMDFATAQQMLLDGKADVIDPIFETPARAGRYDFSPSYANVGVGIYTDHSITGIAGASDLHGFTVGAERGDACVEKLRKAGVTSINQYTDYDDIIAAAQARDIRIFCMDDLPAAYYMYRRHAQQQFVRAFDFYSAGLHRAVRKGDAATLATVEKGMSLITDGERAQLRDKWMGQPLDLRSYETAFMILSGALATAGLVLLIWIYTLRRGVRRRTRELEFLTHFDTITGLPNRQLLLDRIDHAISQKDTPIAVLMVDLDNFKRINDSFGHPQGDKLLQEIAERLKTVSGPVNTVARLSGDDFVIVARAGEVEQVTLVAEEARRAIAQVCRLEGKDFFISASVGISMYPADGADGITLVKNADAAMFRAKQSGRNSIAFYSAALSAQASTFITLGASIRKAIEQNEFELLYQPQYCLATGQVHCVEALVRWRQDGRLIPPSDFIAYAEEHGLIEALGTWVLRTACLDLSGWLADGVPAIRMAVNLSPRQLACTDLLKTVNAALEDACLPPRLLELEITEGALVQSDPSTISVLRGLRALGIDVAIDDFGTGYSSLAYLRNLPVSVIKVDKSFLAGVPEERNAMQLITAIVAMSHAMKMRVVAEGVEREEQAAFLREIGCDLAQGWLFARPMRSSELRGTLRRGTIRRIA
jgi:diguanylate cyclase (GGDEF)-like protein